VPSLVTIYSNRAAAKFREYVRPTLVGNLARIEPTIAEEAAIALGNWLVSVVEETMRTTKLNDKSDHIRDALLGGIRVYGRRSLSTLRGEVKAYPWVAIHETGGIIEPTEGREYLAIPIFWALRADGSRKFASPLSWKRFGSFIYTQKKTGKKFIAYKSDGNLRILYILVHKVEIKPQLRLIETAGMMFDELWALWTEIYLNEIASAGVFNLWDFQV
jgi:hypothetical protein